MTLPKLIAALGAAGLLTACEARIGNDAPPVAENASAEGRAEEGRFTVEAPGFNLSIDIPESIEARADVEDDNGLIYPGAAFGGMHVQGRPDQKGDDGGGEVELRFTTADAADRVVAWYRDPARAGDIAIESARREGNAVLIAGTVRREDQERFAVRITPHERGTELRLVLYDRH
jgi:hypothetical protein